MNQESPSVELKRVTKSFAGTPAVNELDLAIGQGEFFSLLGPSGCGKSTTLRLIGGLEQPDAGEVLIDGEVVNGKPANQRNSNIVFQNYALFPHLSIKDNVAFGLRLRPNRTPEARVETLVDESLDLVQLAGFEKRYPDELSGGQQQRVALARALVLRPKVLLLDEPLGALDRKLRKEMQIELRRIQHEVGITFLYVTHDQEEAMSMSDRVAVMRDGRFEQVATPREIFQTPRTEFTANFVGASNIVAGHVERASGVAEDSNELPQASIRLASGAVLTAAMNRDVTEGAAVRLSVRPEDIALRSPDADVQAVNRFEGEIVGKVYFGEVTEFSVDVGGGVELVGRVESRRSECADYGKGDRVIVCWEADDCNLLAE